VSPRQNARRPVRPAVYGLLGLVACAVLVALAMNVGRLPIIGEGGREISANFSDAGGIDAGDRVEVAGIRVGTVKNLEMGPGYIRISFTVPDDLRVGARTRAAIKVGNLLGSKFINVVPAGSGDLQGTIPLSRTTSPYDVTTAFADLTETVEPLDTDRLAEALDAVSETFAGSGSDVRSAVRGLTDLSRTISTRDEAITNLLADTDTLTASLDGSRTDIAKLVKDAGTLLAELDRRRDALHGVIVHTRDLAKELNGLVEDNDRTLKPTLASLGKVTAQLERRQADLRKSMRAVAKFARLFVNTIGGGPWFDSYIGNAPDSLRIEEP
jgi:phospholipid/cholesterol/gamma-HCH transport system substrate-binding protein